MMVVNVCVVFKLLTTSWQQAFSHGLLCSNGTMRSLESAGMWLIAYIHDVL